MERQQIRDYREAVEYLYGVPRFTNKNTTEDTKAFLAQLGNPDQRMQIIHVAGTNGKGSVCAYLRSILEAAGYRVCVFTSPHLVEARERFLVDGEEVGEETFYNAFMAVYDLLDWERLEMGMGYHPTFFEFLFFMSMVIFEKAAPEYVILETGLGGRLDATNAVSVKLLAILTRIGLDHTEYLGNTLSEIAGEKAGILRERVPFVYLDSEKEVTEVFVKRAEELGASAFPVSKCDYRLLAFENKKIDFSYCSRYYGYIRLSLHTIARYQMENASLAMRAAEVLDEGKTITREHLERGISEAFWAGRMEEIRPDVYVDGAHNEDGIRAFLDSVAQDGLKGGRKLLFGAVQDKDYRRMIKDIADSGLFEEISVVQISSPRAVKAAILKSTFEEALGKPVEIYDTAKEAYLILTGGQKQGERIYVAGSLYLIGEIGALTAG